MIKHGLLRDVYRERWGNGLTPQGAMFLTAAAQAIAPVLPALIHPGNPIVEDPGGAGDGTANDRSGESGQPPIDLSALAKSRADRRATLTETNEQLDRIVSKLSLQHQLKPIPKADSVVVADDGEADDPDGDEDGIVLGDPD